MQKETTEHTAAMPSLRRAERDKTRQRIHWITKTGILSAIAIALMYLEFPVPIFPVFLKFDFADIPAMLGTFSMGPLTGILIQLIRNIAHLPATHTMMVGELANFIMGSCFVGIAGLIYRYKKTRGGAILALIGGTIALTVSGSLVNYFLTVPFYINAMGFTMEAIVGLTHAVGNTLVHDMRTLILFVFVPFNILKGFIISLIVGLSYKRLSPLLHK